MNIRKDIKVEGKHGRPVLLDTYYLNKKENQPIIILLHGFKGFKDWGHWHLMAESFAQNNYYFVKFNFSHNGTTPENPLEFGDLEAFGRNNYSKEEADLDVVLDWLAQNNTGRYNMNDITLVGHSRGGGLAIVKAARDSRIKRLITLASVQQLGFASRHPEVLDTWKKEGVHYIINGRTQQKMPLYYQLHEDVIQNKEKFDVEKAARSFSKPWLIIHGTEDPAVSVNSAYQMKEWYPQAQLEIIEGANHVFGGSHPYEKEELPAHTGQLLDICIEFLK